MYDMLATRTLIPVIGTGLTALGAAAIFVATLRIGKAPARGPSYPILMETLEGFPNPRPLPATLHPARFARPRALWLRRAKPGYADARSSVCLGAAGE